MKKRETDTERQKKRKLTTKPRIYPPSTLSDTNIEAETARHRDIGRQIERQTERERLTDRRKQRKLTTKPRISPTYTI